MVPQTKMISRSSVVDWGQFQSRIKRLKSFSLHLYTFIQFQKTRLHDSMNRRFVTCFRDVDIHIIAVSRTLHSSNHNASENGRFESLTIVFDDAIVLPQRPRCTSTTPDTVPRTF